MKKYKTPYSQHEQNCITECDKSTSLYQETTKNSAQHMSPLTSSVLCWLLHFFVISYLRICITALSKSLSSNAWLSRLACPLLWVEASAKWAAHINQGVKLHPAGAMCGSHLWHTVCDQAIAFASGGLRKNSTGQQGVERTFDSPPSLPLHSSKIHAGLGGQNIRLIKLEGSFFR